MVWIRFFVSTTTSSCPVSTLGIFFLNVQGITVPVRLVGMFRAWTTLRCRRPVTVASPDDKAWLLVNKRVNECSEKQHLVTCVCKFFHDSADAFSSSLSGVRTFVVFVWVSERNTVSVIINVLICVTEVRCVFRRWEGCAYINLNPDQVTVSFHFVF